MEDNNRDFDVRREYRRKRRVRNQVVAYISVIILLAGIIMGAAIGVRTLAKNISEKKQAEELAAQLEEISSEEEAVVEPPESEVEEPAEEVDWLEEMVETCIAEMPLEDKVAGLFVVTPEALAGVDKAIKAGDGTKEALNQYAVGGLIYFSQNIQDEEQLKGMLSNTASMSKYPLFLGVDEEGGSVRSVGESKIEVPEIGDMADIGASGDTMEAYNAGSTIASYLYELGFNVDFAPVADVATDPENSIIGSRSFGSDSTAVGDMVSSMVSGIQDTGVSSCLKHFPGIGSTTEDTHKGMATTEKSLEDMKASDFIPFQSGIEAGADFVMVSHVSAPGLVGDNTPCSMSDKVITDILRNELGYNGIVITDAMDMAAVTEYYASDEAAITAIKAGADMILMPEDFQAAYDGVLTAVKDGVIAEERINESLKRIYRVKYRDRVDQNEVPSADETIADQEGSQDAGTDQTTEQPEDSGE
ncbi:MAG: beta-N-acetylhexosaminidase [Clostridiales bacterium]|nr:beta-N-acetylhexosaminidase [Clostridiales bacterium]